jgi:hypothetical protein
MIHDLIRRKTTVFTAPPVHSLLMRNNPKLLQREGVVIIKLVQKNGRGIWNAPLLSGLIA